MAQVTLSVLVQGLRGCRNRFESAQPHGVEQFHAIFEALAWVGSIRDRLKQDTRGIPPLLEGLYYVRNLVLHQGADVLQWTLFPGAELGMLTLGDSALGSTSKHAWLWPRRDRLTPARSRSGAHEYDTLVAGREVTLVLGQLQVELADLFEP